MTCMRGWDDQDAAALSCRAVVNHTTLSVISKVLWTQYFLRVGGHPNALFSFFCSISSSSLEYFGGGLVIGGMVFKKRKEEEEKEKKDNYRGWPVLIDGLD